MTAVQLLCFASFAGALLFFTAGAAAMVLLHRSARGSRQGRAEAVEAAYREVVQQRDAANAELARLREAESTRADELTQLRKALDQTEAAAFETRGTLEFENRSTIVQPAREADLVRHRAEAAEREVAAVRARADREAAALRTRIEAAEAELARTRAELTAAHAAVAAAHAAAKAPADELRAAQEREQQLAGDVERARTEATALRGELEQLEARLREAEQQLAERAQTVRDLSQENEQLKGRQRDAETLRGEYVRLRTAATETTFLKSEIERLQGELRALKIEALGGKPRRPARGSDQALSQPPQRSIGESLSSVIERFTDSSTRSVAIADPAGFPLASSGEDGQALAAYAALLLESASRAGQFLPVAAPSVVEIVDHSGARISVWTFDVDSERLLLANLAVAPAEPARVESALADLAAILAPSAAVARSPR